MLWILYLGLLVYAGAQAASHVAPKPRLSDRDSKTTTKSSLPHEHESSHTSRRHAADRARTQADFFLAEAD